MPWTRNAFPCECTHEWKSCTEPVRFEKRTRGPGLAAIKIVTKIFTKYINENTVLPKNELVSAVFLVALNGSKILAIENERGWDIPGGHVEGKETPEEALIREVEEEAGASFSNAKLFAILGSNNKEKYIDKVMFVYITNNFKLGQFTPSEDAFDRGIIEINDFLLKYKQHFNISELILHARRLLK